ncbi:hypothetical protein NQ176_g10304 [Zarea fungicola]|uniref:Uncharacterized protein n=1 Tax=Zarea fungicola TaxID=93591 RepID=A0ACC1MGP3_9HYPO|nr:hypothetical protein NQ176_g10304 [Lecanicillium fungicola]
MAMAEYNLSVHSFTPPSFPEVPKETQPSEIRSGLIAGSFAAATKPLFFTLSLPGAQEKNPLHPATHLQLTFAYAGTGEIFVPNLIMPGDLTESTSAGDAQSTLYNVEISPRDIARVKVNEGESPDAEVRLYAWRKEKLLGKWVIGTIKGLGIEGLKSTDLAKKRVEHWKAEAAKKLAA